MLHSSTRQEFPINGSLGSLAEQHPGVLAVSLPCPERCVENRRIVRPGKGRIAVWVRRYLPAELLTIVVSLLCAWLVVGGAGHVAAAIVIAWAEALVYYGLMLGRDLRARTGGFSLLGLLITLRNLALEFGPAELLDSMLIRPVALYGGLTLMPDVALGVIVGKLVADLIFYLPTIISYEVLRQLQLSNKE